MHKGLCGESVTLHLCISRSLSEIKLKHHKFYFSRATAATSSCLNELCLLFHVQRCHCHSGPICRLSRSLLYAYLLPHDVITEGCGNG
jgi:hypothetical protein